MKHSHPLTDIENSTLEEYLVTYHDGVSDYITKDDLDGVQVIPLNVNF